MENRFYFSATTTDDIRVTAEVFPTAGDGWADGKIFVNGTLWFKFHQPDFFDALDRVEEILRRISFR